MRTGHIPVAKSLLSEANVVPPAGDNWEGTFANLHSITSDLRKGSFDSLLTWSDQHFNALENHQSGKLLLVSLGSLIFCNLLRTNASNSELLLCIRSFFLKNSVFISEFFVNIKRLFGALAYRNYILSNVTSPYDYLFSNDRLSELESLFFREYCQLSNLSPQSDLEMTVNVGLTGLPSLIEMRQRAQSINLDDDDFTKNQPVTVEFDLGPVAALHNVFVCPVSREQATDQNKPVLLNCGHVINELTLERIAAQGRDGGRRFKCPVCQSVNKIDRPEQLLRLKFYQSVS
ncbi:hypothetical protein GEMRC1_004524 [Eukaryota sp. GEM-RC1]